MEQLEGRVAVITGGANGIGLGIARAFAAAGARLALFDVEEGALEAAQLDLAGRGADVIGVRADVSDPASMDAAARQVEERFGRVHVLCNNAGVLVQRPLAESSSADWRWLVGVNLFGVVNGLERFLPGMRAHGEGGHVVNTSSVAGLLALPGLGVYSATKFAVLALSETLRAELAPEGIGVSVLCPGGVRTRIHEAGRNRPDALGGPDAAAGRSPATDSAVVTGMDPDRVGECVVRAVQRDELYVLTHPEFREAVAGRAQGLLDAFDRSASESA
jgi:NAD(P)-dependent dehydrogenase (short-subunit alcohol dehydrogenase family)